MTLTGAIVVFLTSLSALPISYTFNTISNLKDQKLTLLSGLLSFVLVVGVPWLILRNRLQKLDPFFYVLSLLTFNSVMSLIIALENDGLIAEFMRFYLLEGEPHLKTAHGTMTSYWDGIAHYALYLMMLAALSWNQSFYDVGLYWVGSFAYSKVVLVLAVFLGKDGIRLPFLLNFPCLLICAAGALRFLGEKYEEGNQIQAEMKEESHRSKEEREKYSTIWKRPADLLLCVYYLFAACITIFRFIAVMGGNVSAVTLYCQKIEPYLTDSLPFPKAQMMIHLFYFVPYHVMSIHALVRPGHAWVTRWSLVHAGAAGQSQFCYMGSSLHYRTPYLHRVPQTSTARLVFWIVNTVLFVMPQFAAYRCLNDPEQFLQETKSSMPDQSSAVVNNGKNVSSNNSGKKSD